MVEEIMEYKAPIGRIPEAQIVAAELYGLRNQRRRLRKQASIEENERKQLEVTSRLIAMGRQDLVNYRY